MTKRPRVVVAPTAFKGTLTPSVAGRALAAGVRRVWPRAQIDVRPLADGGTGLLDACRALLQGEVRGLEVSGPLGERVPVEILWHDDTAVIESGQACGLDRVPDDRRDPTVTTTRGVGELLAAAAARRAGEILLGLGGSATVDAGTGMARALGWSFLDGRGSPLPEGGGALLELARIEAPERAWEVPVMVLCDVENPLIGDQGAARIYGPQKGASPEQVERLEAALARFASVVRRDVGRDVARLPGAGAAGGLGAGAHAFLDGRLVPGAEWMIERSGLWDMLPGADLLVTGEGQFDAQSAMGKITGRLIELASGSGTPVVLVCGRIEGRLPRDVHGIDGRGRHLGPEDLAELTSAGCRALAAERGW